MASVLWLSLCLVLFAHNLVELMSDRHQLSYKIVEQGDKFFDEDHDLNYLACTPFLNIKDKDTLTYEPAIQVSVRSFLNHSIASIEHRLNVTNLFHLNESFIFNEHVCFPITKNELEKGEEGTPFNEFFGEYEVIRFFIYSKEKQPNFYEKAYYRKDDLRSIYLRAYKKKVFGANYLLNADCSNRAHQIHHDRFSCLNRCFKEFKMKAAFYRFDDENTFDLSEILKDKQIEKREANDEEETLEISKKIASPSSIKGAEDCLKGCPERDCFWEVVITLKIDYRYYKDYLQQEGKEKIGLQLNTYVAFYSMDDFYLQLFSLLTLFTGTSVLTLLHALLSIVMPVTARKIEPLLRNEKLLRIFRLVLRNLKHTPTLLCFVLVLVQGLVMVNEFRFHSSHPNRTSSLNVSSEPFSVVICFLRYKADASTLRRLTLNSFKEVSNSLLSERTKSIEIYSGNKRIEQEVHISDEVLFKSSKFNNKSYLSRCLRLDFDLDESYRKMPLTYLQIEFNTSAREIFLIERTQNFTFGLVNFRGMFYPQKVTKKRSKSSVKSNCRDYSEEEEGCGSRRNCLDRCLSMRFIEKHGSIPMNTVVSSSHFNSTWLNRSIYFNETVDPVIEEKCFGFFNQTDCNEVYFEESSDRVKSEVDWLVYIRLIYLNIVEREMEYDWMKTLLDIIGLETVLFGFNALGVLITVLLFLCRILRLKWRKVYRVFLFLLASVGFLVHNVLVFRTIISGDLHENEFFERPERYSLPSPILCFSIRKEVDENHRVTGGYLDHLTAEMTFQHIIREIQYINRTHEKVLYTSRLNSTKSSSFYSSPELELSHFYYRGRKCLKTRLKISYREEDFLLLTNKTVLNIYLNGAFANRMNSTIFLHQQADSREIGGGFNMTIGKYKRNQKAHYRYNIEFEQFRIVREDQFEMLKDPKRLFQERVKVNDAKIGEVVRRHFEKDHNRTTDNLPLDENFDAEMDNELYEQHAKMVTDQSAFKSLDFVQNIANTYTNVYYPKLEVNDPHFSFFFSFLVRRVVITNSVNYTKLVVSLLNTLSLWLGVCVMDMGPWFSRFFAFALHFYRLLVNTRNRLERLRK